MANKTLATIALLASTAVLVLVVAGTMVNKEKNQQLQSALHAVPH
jgi:hypothetical protein